MLSVTELENLLIADRIDQKVMDMVSAFEQFHLCYGTCKCVDYTLLDIHHLCLKDFVSCACITDYGMMLKIKNIRV